MKKVLGIGNALVDIMVKLSSDELLEKLSIPKGSMQLIDKSFLENFMKETSDIEKSLASGGSAANTIHGLANLNIPTGFIGTVHNDEMGAFFKEDMLKKDIEPKLFEGKEETGRAIALVSPDSERTFATFLGAAIEIAADSLNAEQFEGYDIFHVEGYLVLNQDLLIRSAKLAKEKGLKISIDLASYNVVEDNLEFLKNYVSKYVDIVFANEQEAKAFTGLEPREALDAIAEVCEIAVVKIGAEGSFIKKGDEVHQVGVIQAKCIDTTGAGDLYAGGFLYGLVNNLPLNKCGDIGAILSGNVIEVLGAKMDEQRWSVIKEKVNAITFSA